MLRAPRGPWIAAAPLSAAALVLYLATLSQHYASDACLYAYHSETGSGRAIILPHHLLLHPLGWAWFRLWQAAGWSGGAMQPLQVLNALAGAVCVGQLCRLCARCAASTAIGVLVAGAAAVSGGFWLSSTEAEFVTVPLAVELLVLGWILGRAGSDTPAAVAVVIGLSIGLCALVYLTTLALLPAALLALCAPAPAARHRGRTALLLLAGCAIPVVAGALVALHAHGWHGSLVATLRPGRGYGVISWESVPRGAYAFLRTLVLFPGLGISDRTLAWGRQAGGAQLIAFAGVYLAAALAAATPLVLAARRRPRLERPAVVLAWTGLHAGFSLLWVPSDLTLWLPIASAWWMLVAAVAAGRRRARPLLAGAALLLFVINGLGVIVPHHRPRTSGSEHPCAFIRGDPDGDPSPPG